MSSLNVELVHTILHAVSMRTVGTPKSQNMDNYYVYQDYDHKSKNEFVIESIEIHDYDQWDIS